MEPGFRPVDLAEPVELAAGPVTLTLHAGAIRWIRVAGVEVVRGINVAVRGPGWSTLTPRFIACELRDRRDAFDARFHAECDDADGPLIAWTGAVSGASDGTIAYRFEGTLLREFTTPRIGLCVLHPRRLAGGRLDIETPFGIVRGHLPVRVTHLLPFSNICRIRHDRGTPHETRIDLAGDVFEMEDQRAFGDASFKTFSRPLALPAPYVVGAGTVIRQSVTVSLPRAAAARRQTAAGVGETRGQQEVAVRIGDGRGRPMPLIGTRAAPGDVAMDAVVREAVADLGLAHLGASVAVDDPDAAALVDGAAAAAAAAGCALELALVATPGDERLGSLLGRVAASGVPVARLAAFDPRTHGTTAPLAAGLRAAATAAGSVAPVFGGTRAYLYQLVSEPLPAAILDGVMCPVSPQVHAFDDASITESIETLPDLVETVSTLAGGLAVAVGPVALRPSFNPDAVPSDEATPAPAPGTLPARYDRRQVGDLAAAWTVGVVAALAAAGVAAVTIHESAGWGGLVAARHDGLPDMGIAPGEVLPAGHATAALARMTGEVLSAVVSSPAVAGVAVRAQDGAIAALVANLDRRPALVRLDLGPGGAVDRVEVLGSAAGGAGRAWRTMPGTEGIALGPYAVARVTGRRS